MSKQITSPSKLWPGTVTLADKFTLPQVEMIEDGFGLPPEMQNVDRIWNTVFDKRQIPPIIACVEKWELENFPTSPTLETWEWTPRGESHKLVAWLFGEIKNIYIGEVEIPNE